MMAMQMSELIRSQAKRTEIHHFTTKFLGNVFTHLKRCLAHAIHSFKLVIMILDLSNWRQIK